MEAAEFTRGSGRIERTFLAWVTTREAGPVVDEPVVYVQEATGRRRSTETVRFYRDEELRLVLGVPRVRIDAVQVEAGGGRAMVNFYGPGDVCGPGPTAELVKSRDGWTVRGYADDRLLRLLEPDPMLQ